MEKTTNLGLNLPGEDDFYNINDFNKNMQTIDESLPKKVDKVDGKQLSTNDYTNTEKEKLAGIEEGANAYTHPDSGVTAGTYRSVTVNAQGHVTGGSNPTLPVNQGGTGATTAAKALSNLGLTATATELNYVDGVTSAIQTQLNGKATYSTGSFDLKNSSGAVVLSGTYYKFGRFVCLYANGQPKVAITAGGTLTFPFTSTHGSNGFFRLAEAQTNYPSDGGVNGVTGTTMNVNTGFSTSKYVTFTAMYITAS